MFKFLVMAIAIAFSACCKDEEKVKSPVKEEPAKEMKSESKKPAEVSKPDEEEKQELDQKKKAPKKEESSTKEKKSGDNNSDHEAEAKQKGAEAIKKMMKESAEKKQKQKQKKQKCRDTNGQFMKCSHKMPDKK